MPWVLGLDGSSTKTVALVANEKGRVLGRGEAGPAQYHTIGLRAAAESIRAAVRAAIEDAGLLGQALSAASFALAGVDRTTDRQVMAGVIASLGLGCPIKLDLHASAALAGATGGLPGAVVVAGTGSIAYGEDQKGNTYRAGGYGPVLGDEGGGYDIGRRAMLAALRAEDGRGPATILGEKLKKRFMLTSVSELINLVYGDPPPLGRPEIAGLTPMVIEAAHEGDTMAREILRVAGRELGLLAAAVLTKLEWAKDQPVPVAGSGSAFEAGNLLALPMQQVIRSACPQAEIVQPRHTASYGAVLLALRHMGIRLEDLPGDKH